VDIFIRKINMIRGSVIIFILFKLLCVEYMYAQSKVTIPYSTSFENFSTTDAYDELGSEGWIEEGTSGTKVFESGGSCTGNMALKFRKDYITSNFGSLSHGVVDATLVLDMSTPMADYCFSMMYKSVATASNGSTQSCLIQNEVSNTINDGIFLSCDGGVSYIKVYELLNTNGQWMNLSFNINSLASISGIVLNDKCRIKIQYDCWSGSQAVTECVCVKYLMIDDVNISSIVKSNRKVKFRYDDFGNRQEREMMEVLLTKSAQLSPYDENKILEPQEEMWNTRKLTVYPNPTKGDISLEVSGGADDDVFKYTVYSISGSLVLEGLFEGQGQHPVNMSQLKSGTYIMVVVRNDETIKFRIIKE
jgi:hypothetical protein